MEANQGGEALLAQADSRIGISPYCLPLSNLLPSLLMKLTISPADLRAITLPRSIKVRNARFDALSPVLKRKAIALDALTRLKSRQLKPTRGKWVSIPVGRRKDVHGHEELRTLLERRAKPLTCRACALGAAIMGLAAWKNEMKVNSRDWSFGETEESVGIGFRDDDVSIRLEAIFSVPQLQLIENAFERGHGSLDIPETKLSGVTNYAARYPKDRDLFKAIFTSILNHPEGLFVP